MRSSVALKQALGTKTLGEKQLQKLLQALSMESVDEYMPDEVCVLSGSWVRQPDGSYTFHDKEDL